MNRYSIHQLSLRCLIALFGLALFGLASVSATTVEKKYLVELIAFEHITSSPARRSETEDFKRYPSQAGRAKGRNNSAHTISDIIWKKSGPLKKRLAALSRSSQYRILGYRAWQQPLTNKKHTQVVPLNFNPDTADSAMTGDLTIFENQLVYARLDLTMDHGIESSHLAPWDQKQTVFQIHETRRIRLNENHYFDHPRIGVIIRLSRVEH